MSSTTLAVGNAEITAILDVDTSIPLDALFDGSGDPLPGGAGSIADRYGDEFSVDAWHFRDHCFLVRTPGRLTLIDTGSGPADSAFGRWLGVAGSLQDELSALGVAPDDIDDVILTHVHSDHTGWSTMPSASGRVPRFPNARYYVHGADVEWMRAFTDEDAVREFAEVIAPLEASEQLDVSLEDREVSPGLSLRHAPGHTPGHRCVLLDASDERVLFTGDLLHFTFQLNDPWFRAPGEHDPDEACRTRAAWLDRAESERLTVATAHVPPSPIGRIVRVHGERLIRPR
ncbi:MAG TPA: MBL fold metallo-hydrolase [Actinomycetota bacterium]|jgi:glyoxylase-like metal-dependent hydrolase (beta-lactamase superfamily II)|nr:MBL fold metallo-hydrolase [Actinomycetota bacterium]